MESPTLLTAVKDLFREIIREELRSVILDQKPSPILVDTAGAAALLQLPQSWVAAAARRGEIPCVRCGHHVRFRVGDLQQFIENSCHTQNFGAASAAKARRRGRKSSADGATAGAAQAGASGAAS
jgi:excisionase family DNA binding protein